MHIPDIQRKAQQEFPSWKGMTLHHPLNSPLAFRISQKPIVHAPSWRSLWPLLWARAPGQIRNMFVDLGPEKHL